MSNYRKHIDRLFKEKLGNYRETPPPDVWDALETRLDGLAPVPSGFPFRWIAHIVIISAIVILGVVVSKEKMSNSGNTQTAPLAQNNTTQGAQPAPYGNTESTTGAQPAQTGVGETSATVGSNTTTSGRNNYEADNKQASPVNNTPHNASSKQMALASTKSKQNKKPQTRNYGNKTTSVNPSSTYNAPKSTSSYQKSPISNPSPEDFTNDPVTDASPNTTLSVVAKPEVPAGTENIKSTTTPPVTAAIKGKAKHKPVFPLFEAGVKMGYEGGFTADAAKKAVVSPYLQYNLSPKFSVMIQPAIKAASSPNRTIGAPETYYNANPEDAKVTQNGPTVVKTVGSGSNIVTTYTTSYTYSQTHDSIVKTNKTGGTAIEYELPVMLKYNVTKHLSVYGGPNMVYSKYPAITEETYTQDNIVRSYDKTVVSNTAPTGTPTLTGFTYTGKNISSDDGPLVPAQSGYQFRPGYMVGISYTYRTKWLLDAQIQQNPAKADYKGGYNLNAPLSAPYFRLSVGYKLTK